MIKNEFENLNIKPEIKEAISLLHLDTLTPIQSLALPYILEGKDVLGQAPTGTGKTFAYAIGMVDKIDITNEYVKGLVITPTRELAMQSADEIRKLLVTQEGISVVPLFGGSPMSRQISTMKKKPSIVVGTPGRLLDHIDRHTLKLGHIETLVIDECDELLDMGFIKDVLKIIEAIKNKHQTILFSATISKEIEKVSHQIQNEDVVRLKVEREKIKPIKQYYLSVKEEDKLDSLLLLLGSITFETAFIFARTKRKVAKLQKQLSATPYKTTCIHGDLPQGKRTLAMKSFKSKETPILIATDIAARGIDVSSVDIVINYDVPEQDEYYLHRIGRVGRADKTGVSYAFINSKQHHLLPIYEKMTNDKIEEFNINNQNNKKEGLSIMEKAILEKAKRLVSEDLTEGKLEVEQMCNELNVDAVTLAAAILKASTKVEDSSRGERSRSKERVVFEKIDNTQRFFINIGRVDGLDEAGLMSFVCKYAPEVTNKDFADVYIKGTFSFFEVKAELKDVIMEKINNTGYGKREVHVELSAAKDEADKGGKGSYKKDYKSKGDHYKRREGSRSSSGSSDGRRSYSRDNKRSYGSSDRKSSYGNSENKSSYSGERKRSYSSDRKSSYGTSENKRSYSRDGGSSYGRREGSSRSPRSYKKSYSDNKE